MTARVLIVDDTPFNVKLLDTKLKQEYYDVVTASNGVQALELVKTAHPDIILLDVMMPIMDGMETARRIKANPETTHIPIIMITALDGQEDRVRGLEAGADDFLSKPVDEQALMARIKSLLRLKLMMDELLLRDQTALQYGLIEQPTMDATRSVEGAEVLLIEDDKALGKKIHSTLATKKINVDNCHDTSMAITQATQKDYSAIIVNVNIMGKDGLRLCSHFKSHELLRHVPILLLAEPENKPAIMRGLEIGVNDYITMPVEVNELLARVSTQIRRKRYQDILRNQYAQSLSMSVTDPLTSLYNRRYLDMHISSLIHRANTMGKSLSLLMVDLDHFKSVNDTYGHQTGDIVLKEVASRILSRLRITDLCARYGGEELVVVMSETEIEQAAAIAERLRVGIDETNISIPVPPGQLHCTCSIGVATMVPGDTPESIVERADKCLYEAKEQGRNCVAVSKLTPTKESSTTPQPPSSATTNSVSNQVTGSPQLSAASAANQPVVSYVIKSDAQHATTDGIKGPANKSNSSQDSW